MDANGIIELVLAAVIGIMGYFIKVIHGDVRQNTKDVGENKGCIKNLNTQVEHEREMRNQSYNSIMAILGEIKDDLKDLKK